MLGFERKAYTDAVLCMQRTPSKLDAGVYPGAKTRFDDFIIVHANQSRSIHGTGNFLTWHRYFTWTYEQVLKNECGYKGAQPVSSPHTVLYSVELTSISTGTGAHTLPTLSSLLSLMVQQPQ